MSNHVSFSRSLCSFPAFRGFFVTGQQLSLRTLPQLDLACEADISTRHLSFLETGRSLPSREMVIHLAERLEVPLRERNALLIAAGYAPIFPERPLTDPALQVAREAIDLVLAGHEPYPALAIDRCWNLIAANRAVAPLLMGVEPALLAPPVNVLRLNLHPAGLAPRIANLMEWRAHLLARLRRDIEISADSALMELRQELSAYPLPANSKPQELTGDSVRPVVPFQLMTEAGIFSFISTTTVFGTPVDITLAEIALEAFFPADAATAAALRLSAQAIE